MTAGVDQGVRHCCSFSPVLFDFFLDEVICRCLNTLKTDFILREAVFTTLLFADYLILTAESGAKLQEAVYKLSHTGGKYNLNTSLKKTKQMVFAGVESVRRKIIVDRKVIERVSTSKFLGCEISYGNN